MVAQLALDMDGPIAFALLREGDRLLTHTRCVTAERIEGPNPPGRVVYEADRFRYLLHAPSAFDRLGTDGGRGAHRVRTTDLLAWAAENASAPGMRVASALRFGDCFGGASAGGEAVLDDGLDLLEHHAVRTPNPLGLDIVDRQVFPRTIAAYIEWSCDETGERLPERVNDASTIVIDIGLRETTIVRIDNEAMPVPEGQLVVASGWLVGGERLATTLAHVHGVHHVRPDAVLNILMTGVYRSQGHTRIAVPHIHQTQAPLVALIAEALMRLSPREREPIVAVGVPAAMVAAALEHVTGLRICVPQEPAFANARGLVKVANFAVSDEAVTHAA